MAPWRNPFFAEADSWSEESGLSRPLISAVPFVVNDQYRPLLTHLGAWPKVPLALAEPLIPLLEDMLQDLSILFEMGVSQYTLSHWVMALTDIVDPDFEKSPQNYSYSEWFKAKLGYKIVDKQFYLNKYLTSVWHKPFIAGAKLADAEMSWIYIGLSLISLIEFFMVLAGADPFITPAITFLMGVIWNFNDSAATIPSSWQFLSQGELRLAFVNMLGAAQMTGCTIVAMLAQYTSLSSLAVITSSAIGGLTGFSFAVGMLACYRVEQIKIHKCDQHIEDIQRQLTAIERALKNSSMSASGKVHGLKVNGLDATDDHERLLRRQNVLRKTLVIEKARRENSVRSARAYLACTVVMVAVAVTALVAVSGLSCGGVPLAVLVVLGGVLLTGLLREYWARRVNHVANAKLALTPSTPPAAAVRVSATSIGSPLFNQTGNIDNSLLALPASVSLVDRLQACVDKKAGGWDFTRVVSVKPWAIVYANPVAISFESYLKDLAFKNPTKLSNIVNALELPDVQQRAGAFRVALTENKHVSWCSSETLGAKIMMAYEQTYGAMDHITPVAPPDATPVFLA